jgi:hypothetical protein
MVNVDPEDAAPAIGNEAAPEDVVESAIADEPNSVAAADKLAAYNAMSDEARAARTLLPPLATWNAMVIVNPMLGKVLAKALDYMLLKSLNDYPFEGVPVMGGEVQNGVCQVIINSEAITHSDSVAAGKYIALPFFRFTIAASTLNARPGAQIRIDIKGTDAQGRQIDTMDQATPYYFSFQRINNTQAVVGVFIPTTVVATRTLPFLPIAGDDGDLSHTDALRSITITFTGVASDEQVMVVVPGYATSELKEISAMYSLPSGLIR